MTPATTSDFLTSASHPDTTWTTTNVAELLPGVVTPLCWDVFGPAAERAMRGAFVSMGALEPHLDAEPARTEDRVVSIFHGRGALRVDFLCEMADRMPGGSGAQIAEQVFSASVPEGAGRPAYRHYPRVARRLPPAMVRTPARMRAVRQATERRWRSEIAEMGARDLPRAQLAFTEARTHYAKALRVHVLLTFAVVQPIYDLVGRLVEASGQDADVIQAGHGGHEESRLLDDLWACSRDRLPMAEVVRRHGYHGPREGELSAVTWREDPAPLESILANYRALDDASDPAGGLQRRRQAREAAERRLLASLPAHRRPAARAVLALAARYIPMRSVGKVAYQQGFDTVRAATRRCGEHLVTAGVLDVRDDVFLLTADELLGAHEDDVRHVIATRRDELTRHRETTLPALWRGAPGASSPAAEARDGRVQGLGVSGGVVTGRVRVVTEPGDSDLEPDEVLVAHVTDPSWSSILLMSSALVTDIGGALSHAAVVARELGVPCVVDTKHATRTLRDGDLCRVDGHQGTVEVLERAPRAD